MSGYNLIRGDRKTRKGGGVAIYIRNEIPLEVISTNFASNGEAEGTFIDVPQYNLSILCLNLPPNLCAASSRLIRNNINEMIDIHPAMHPKRDMMILGDFNNFNVRQLSSDLSVTDIIKKPTRGKNILDQIFISEKLKPVYNSEKVTYEAPIGKSDHLTLIVEPENYVEKLNEIRKHTIYDYRESNLRSLMRTAKTIPWNNVVNPEDKVDKQWEDLYSCIISLLNASIPQKTVYLTPRDKTWMTPLTKMLINDKWSAYRTGDWNRFNHLKYKVREEINKAKRLLVAKIERIPLRPVENDNAHARTRIKKPPGSPNQATQLTSRPCRKHCEKSERERTAHRSTCLL